MIRTIPWLALIVACRTAVDDNTKTTEPVDESDYDGDGFTTDDCDDRDASVNPGATEVCDGVDNNCDGLIDEEVMSTWYEDADADGFGNPDVSSLACDRPAGSVPNSADCDDTTASTNPSGVEVCDGVDNNCDSRIDEGLSSLWYVDADSDGYGDPETLVESCEQPLGAVDNPEDCDDSDTAVNPDAFEVCDEIDNDCDGFIDEDDATDTSLWYADVDGDGYGNPDSSTYACEPPSGYTDRAQDCDDLNPDIKPGAPEVCDGDDNDCDGLTDDDDPDIDVSGGGVWYTDADSDGYGDAASIVAACVQPSGTVSDATDCDDAETAVNPAATEICNSIDDDCDGDIDDDDASVDLSTGSTWYSDTDSDGYGDAAASTNACTQPSAYVADATDCDDTETAVNPGATEICNSIDDDCDGDIDDDDASVDLSTGSTWYSDTDSDGYGDPATAADACVQPSGTVTDATDCDDGDYDVNPAATEICFDGIDNDCSGALDDTLACSTIDITTDASDVDLFSLAGSPSTATTIYVTVYAGVTVSGSSTSVPAMSTSGFASGSTVYIENLGTIHGHGGDGACSRGGNGETGGDALEVTVDVELDTSSGGIYGGGGGGGAGDDPTGGGGGAGGGIGCDGGGNASGGVGGHGPTRHSSVPGGNGTNYNGSMGLGGSWGSPGSSGSGGSGGTAGDGSCQTGQGGAGGGWGGGGGGGYACSSSRNPGNGGDAGWAVRVLSGSITITGGNDTTHIKGWVN